MTTHILEEADILSDRICIMNYGRVKIVGTSSELKNRIGAGFKLDIILKEAKIEHIEIVNNFVEKNCCNAQLLDSSGGALRYVIPLNDTLEIMGLLKVFENRSDLKDIVSDFAVSNSTLEEVFIEVTKDDHDLNQTTTSSNLDLTLISQN